MGQRDIGDGFDLGHFQYPQVGLPLAKPIKGIMVGAEVLGHPALPAKGVVKHPAKSDTVDGTGMYAEPQDAARELVHDDQDPVTPQRGRFASEQIYTPEAVFHVTNEGEPGWPSGGRFRPIVTGENPSHHVLVYGDGESQGNLLSDARTAPGGIALLHLDDGISKFSARSFWPWPPPVLGREEDAILSVPQGLVEPQEGRRFQNDGGTDQAGPPYQQSAPTGDEAIREPETGSALARAIKDQQLMFDEDGFGNYGADAAATCKSGDGGEKMDEKDHEIAHFRILTTKRKLAEFRAS